MHRALVKWEENWNFIDKEASHKDAENAKDTEKQLNLLLAVFLPLLQIGHSCTSPCSPHLLEASSKTRALRTCSSLCEVLLSSSIKIRNYID